MKLISVLLNEVFDIVLNNPKEGTYYKFGEPEDVERGKGLGRRLVYMFCTDEEFDIDHEMEECSGFVYKVELNEQTRGTSPPLFELSYNVPTKTVDGGDQPKTIPAKGDAGNRSYEILTGERDTKVLSTVALITHRFIETANKKYTEDKGGYAITWEGTFGDEYGHDAGQKSKDSRERIYKYAVHKFKGEHSNLEIVDEIKSPTGKIQLRFNGWTPAEKDNM